MTNSTNQELRKRKKIIIMITLSLFLCAIIYVIMSFAGVKIPCVFNRLTKLKCPGCGNTRAVKALLQMDIKQAFKHNLLFPLELGYIGWVYIKACHNYIKTGNSTYKPPHIAIDISILVIILIWGIIRNITGC